MNSFFLHLLYIGLFLFSNEGRGVSFVTDGIVERVSMGLTDRRKTAKNLADSRKN